MHLSPKHPRARAQRILSYVLIVIFVSIGTFILTRYTQGFELDPGTGSLVQNGLVLVESEPVESAVIVDDQDIGERTSSRLTLPIGNHTIKLQADGYREWSKTFQIIGSDLVWMNYPLLIPEKIATNSVAVFGTQPVTAFSRNRKILATGQPSSKIISIFNVNGSTVSESELNLPEAITNELGAATLTELTFAADDQFLLAQFSQDSANTYVFINREDIGSSFIMDKSYGLDFNKVQFDSGDADQMYALANNSLYRLKRTNPLSSNLVAENIIAFRSDAKFLSVVQKTTQNGREVNKFGLIDDRDSLTFLSSELSAGDYTIVHGSYDGDESVAISTSDGAIVFSNIGKTQNIKTKRVKILNSKLSFSGNGRFLLIREGENCVVLDFEFNKRYSFKLSGTVQSETRWVDDSHISVVVDGMAKIIEFDGANSQNIIAADKAMAPFSNAKTDAFFTIGLAKERYTLQQSSLVNEK